MFSTNSAVQLIYNRKQKEINEQTRTIWRRIRDEEFLRAEAVQPDEICENNGARRAGT